MVHFTCDLCGRDLNAADEQRFVVKIEAYAGFDPTVITQDDLDEDHMEALAELLKTYDSSDLKETDTRLSRSFRFDLCPECHARFLKDPLGKDLSRLFDFSKN